MQTHVEPLSDARWQVIEQIVDNGRQRRTNLRVVVDVILEILRTGQQWRNCNQAQVKWQTVYYYFSRWSRDGTLQRLNAVLNQEERQRQGKSATTSLVCIDSQSIKAAPFIDQERGIDGNKKINGRKRHILVDTLGLVWGVVVHAADVHDSQRAHELVEHCLGYLDRMKKVLVDDAYRTTFADWVNANVIGIEVEFASRPPTDKGFVPVKWRWVNERTFGWFNFFRRLSKDYEKTVKSAEAWVLWANCQIIVNRFPN
jgi:putative transposase